MFSKNERVISSRSGNNYISVLLPESEQRVIDKFFNINDNNIIIDAIKDVSSFIRDNLVNDNFEPIQNTLDIQYDGVYLNFFEDVSNDNLKKIKDYIKYKQYDEYLDDLNKYWLKFNLNINKDIINTQIYNRYPNGLKDYLDKLQNNYHIVINTVIDDSFSEYFYNCGINSVFFKALDSDDYKVSVNFTIKSKVKGAFNKLDELSSLVEEVIR